MKKTNKILLLLVSFSILAVTCKDSFLVKTPQGSVTGETMKNSVMIDRLVVAAYNDLNPELYGWGKDPNNWTFGSIAGGDAYIGSTSTDQPPIQEIRNYKVTTGNSYYADKWVANFDGIYRCNDALNILEGAPTNADLSEAWKKSKISEVRFLRSFYFFELAKVFGPTQVPWIDATMQASGANPKLTNGVNIWDSIISGFRYAYNNLPSNAPATDAGRVNKWAAGAYLGKALLFKAGPIAGGTAALCEEAATILGDVIANGTTANGKKYALLPNFGDCFNVQFDNSSESVFAQQNSIGDGSMMHSNAGYSLAYPNGGPFSCCGFYQPTFSLVNSFKVDGGLPMSTSADRYAYNAVGTDVKNNFNNGNPTTSFTPDFSIALDPRLDYTAGRMGIPYLNWGLMGGDSWIRAKANGGPYVPIKNVYRKGDATEAVGWWAHGSALNTNLMRTADLYLLYAEALARKTTPDLATALAYVNKVRERAKTSNKVASGCNYQIELYPSSASNDAMRIIVFERKIELAMEGHRFFDLVRWGLATEELGNFVNHEKDFFPGNYANAYNDCAAYGPIPQTQVDLSGGGVTNSSCW